MTLIGDRAWSWMERINWWSRWPKTDWIDTLLINDDCWSCMMIYYEYFLLIVIIDNDNHIAILLIINGGDHYHVWWSYMMIGDGDWLMVVTDYDDDRLWLLMILVIDSLRWLAVIIDGDWFMMSDGLVGVTTLRPGQNGRHFADDTFKRIFL